MEAPAELRAVAPAGGATVHPVSRGGLENRDSPCDAASVIGGDANRYERLRTECVLLLSTDWQWKQEFCLRNCHRRITRSRTKAEFEQWKANAFSGIFSVRFPRIDGSEGLRGANPEP